MTERVNVVSEIKQQKLRLQILNTRACGPPRAPICDWTQLSVGSQQRLLQSTSPNMSICLGTQRACFMFSSASILNQNVPPWATTYNMELCWLRF